MLLLLQNHCHSVVCTSVANLKVNGTFFFVEQCGVCFPGCTAHVSGVRLDTVFAYHSYTCVWQLFWHNPQFLEDVLHERHSFEVYGFVFVSLYSNCTLSSVTGSCFDLLFLHRRPSQVGRAMRP